jgi:hypothetical protein
VPWNIAATVPTPVTAYGGMVVVDGWLYIFGGDVGLGGIFQNNVVIYPTSSIWAWPINPVDGSLGTPVQSELPEPYENAFVAIHTDGSQYGYSCGYGYGDLNADGGTAFGLTNINVFRLIKGRAVSIPQLSQPMPDGVISYLDAAPALHIIGDYLYLHSILAPGLSGRPANVKVGYMAHINDDGSLGPWGSFPPMPTSVGNVNGITFGAHATFRNGLYWAGGQRDDVNTVVTSIYYITVDTVTGQPTSPWNLVGNMSQARFRFGAAVAQVGGVSVLALVGGHDTNVPLALAETAVLNSDGTLSGGVGLIDPVPTPSRNMDLASYGPHIYAAGGHNGLNSNTILPYIYHTVLGANGKQS